MADLDDNKNHQFHQKLMELKGLRIEDMVRYVKTVTFFIYNTLSIVIKSVFASKKCSCIKSELWLFSIVANRFERHFEWLIPDVWCFWSIPIQFNCQLLYRIPQSNPSHYKVKTWCWRFLWKNDRYSVEIFHQNRKRAAELCMSSVEQMAKHPGPYVEWGEVLGFWIHRTG